MHFLHFRNALLDLLMLKITNGLVIASILLPLQYDTIVGQKCVLPRLLSPYLHALAGPRRSLESAHAEKHQIEGGGREGGREKIIHKQSPSGNDDNDVIELQSDITY